MIRNLFSETFGLLLCGGVLLACGGGGASGWRYNRVIRDPVQGDLVAVSCEGQKRECYVGAAKACPSGFEIADSSGRTATSSNGYVTTLPNGQIQGFSKSSSSFEGDLLVRCTPTAKRQVTTIPEPKIARELP